MNESGLQLLFNEQENRQIATFLDYYINLKTPPNYAVLLDGKWGSGKTFFINRIRENYENENRKIVYISLFGITSIDQIDDQIYSQFFSIGKKYLRYGAKVISGFIKQKVGAELADALPLVDGLGEIDPTKLQPKIDNAIFIFDDFERSGVTNREAIGYINNFVEHGNNKVLVVANTEEIDKTEEFLRTFEKVVGRSFNIVPEFDGAFDAFLKNITDPSAISELTKHKAAIHEIFRNSCHKNLRTLKYVLIEIERMINLIPEVNRTPEYLSHIFGSLTRACIEIKSGNLAISEMHEIHEQYQKMLVAGVLTTKKRTPDVEVEGLGNHFEIRKRRPSNMCLESQVH